MASPTKNIASRYLESLQDATPTRLPLKPTLKFNSNVNLSSKKHESPDLEDLARQMNIDTPAAKTTLLRSRFETPSATVSSFKTTPRSDSRKSEKSNKLLGNPFDLKSKRAASSSSRNSKGYEYLCRIQAIKNWLEIVLGEQITQEPAELISYIQNGIHLAKLANVFLPTKKTVYANDSKLEFRHTENINRFFKLKQYLDIPDLFRFELTDLYDAKDVPKVWFCLHAMSYKISQLSPSYPPIENMVGQIDFDESAIRTANRALVGHHLPNFTSADGDDPSSPGRSSYINKTMTFSSPGKSPTIRSAESDNPFREKTQVVPSRTFNLSSVQKPDLSISAFKTPETSPIFSSRDQFSRDDYSRKSPVTSRDYSSMERNSNYYVPEIEDHIYNIVKLQALSKGALYRYKMFVDKIMLKSYDSEFTRLFSTIRGNASRKRSVHRHRDELLLYRNEVTAIQSVARMKLLQRFLGYNFGSQAENCVSRLQCAIRGYVVRRKMDTIRYGLSKHQNSIIGFQSAIRSKDIHHKVSTVSKNRFFIERGMTEFQSIARRVLFQRLENSTIISQSRSSGEICQLQALIRGGLARNLIRRRLGVLNHQLPVIKELQSIGRGGVLRTRLCNSVLITLLGEDFYMNELFAKARGNAVRKQASYKKDVLQYVAKTEIVPLQSIFRGILVRFERDMDTDEIYEEVDSIIGLQARIRANVIRGELTAMTRYYTQNEAKVIRAQAVLKSKYIQTAYKALLNMKNPPVGVVRRFAYLLSNSNTDFQEEMSLTNLKDRIIEMSRANEELELQIENLDIKLSLLDKNKITIEDFMKHNNKYKTYKPASHKAAGLKSMEKLNKSARKRIELYQSMFYFLQTKPSYWIRLYEDLSAEDKNLVSKSLQYHVLLIFPLQNGSINIHSREEYFFVKFVCLLMENDISWSCKNIADITKAKSSFWVDYLVDFNNQVYQRMHLKALMGRTVLRIVDNDDVTFESDPVKIYNLIMNKELRIHGTTTREEEVEPQAAIQDKEVSAAFVSNLIALREATTDTMEILQSSIHRLPIHVRIMARKAYVLSQIHFPDQNDQQHLAVAGVIFIKHYVGSILQYPENYGYSTKDPYSSHLGNNGPSRTAENLKYLNRVLLQVFSMKAFSDNFLKPLNEYVVSYVETTKSIIREVINVKDLDVEYEMNDYDDIVSHERPQLTMKVSDMISVEKLVTRNLDVIAPSLDDQLFALAGELNDLDNSANDYVTLTELGTVTLSLSPTTKEDTVSDSKSRTLFAQAKRCLLYIMRVQEGDDLLELLIQGIRPIHEDMFKEMIQSETKSQTSTNAPESTPYKKSSLGDLSKMSYVELKKLALKVILQLESMNQVTRKNSFQQLLNQIVVDIKTKDSQRVSRKSQLEIGNETVGKLLEKEKFMKRQLADYNKHIDKILSELQLKPKDKKIFNIIPVFSKQYFYHRELKKNNRLPKFGSYKYSAKKLTDQGIVKDFGGELFRKHSTSSRLDFMFSCHKLGTFVIEAANGSVTVAGACNTITLDQLLDYQYENKKSWNMFDGMVTFDTDNLAALIFRKFYDIKKD